MSSETEPSSLICLILNRLVHNHLDANDDDSVIVSCFKETVKNDIKRQFRLEAATIEEDYYLLVIASFCDPCYKTLSYIKTSVKNAAVATVRWELNQID